MAALKKADGTFVVTAVDKVAIPQDDWVLVRIKTSGICGTDLRHWKKEDATLACEIMGHEMAGEVVELGPAVQHIKVGDRVVIETLLGCGHCEWCRIQEYNLCPNLYTVRMKTVSRAFAEFVSVPQTKLHVLPAQVSYAEATLLDTFAVCLHAQHKSDLNVNSRVVIIGGGPIGIGQLQLAKIAGADVLLVDIVDSSLAIALEMGANAVVHAKREDAKERILAFTGGIGADIVFECVGGPHMQETLQLASETTRIGGQIIVVGGFEDGRTAISLDWQMLQKAEIQLILSASYAFSSIYSEMRTCLALVAKGKLNAEALITHRFPLHKINEAFETAADKEATGALFVLLEHQDTA